MDGVPVELRTARKSRFWFYRPEWYADGWSPIYRGHDEHSRRTVVIGWPITGRIVIATRYCGDATCYAESVRWLDIDGQEG